MCRCCQNCWEDFYWNCFEERFCYDESIANYNPDEDEAYIAASLKQDAGALNNAVNNNLLMPPPTICNQPTRNGTVSNGMMIHEEEFRRETQTNVPMLGPEILNVFVNSQIFQEHPHTKLNRMSTKPFISTPDPRAGDSVTTPTGMMNILADQQNKLRQYNEAANRDEIARSRPYARNDYVDASSCEQNVKFSITDPTSSASSSSLSSLASMTTATTMNQSTSTLSHNTAFEPITEENGSDLPPAMRSAHDTLSDDDDDDDDAATKRDANEVILRPPRMAATAAAYRQHPHLHSTAAGAIASKKQLRAVNSFSYFNFNVRSAASDTDIFTISGTNATTISMTPEVPSISFSNLPKNYEDTPTIEKYRVSKSLYSIQVDNAARMSKDDFSMPRYFRRSGVPATPIRSGANEPSPLAALTTKSTATTAAATTTDNSGGSSSGSIATVRDKEKEASNKRLKMLRRNLPPLLIHSVSFRKQNI